MRTSAARLGPTVMIVDDHALARSAIRRALERANVRVVDEAASGEEAISAALRTRPDVLLLDLNMPGMSGIEVVRQLSPRLPETRIVMLTVSDTEADLFAAITAGAKGYLTKELSADALARAVIAAARGELAMPRRFAAAIVEQFGRPRVDSARRDPRLGGLTPRELDVLTSLAQGASDREIAAALDVSIRTVETHVGSILRKLGARNRAAAAAIYRGS